MLSKENVDKIVPTMLYGHEPIDDRFTPTSGNYHCKNWTFFMKEVGEGHWWALDTYFNSWDSHKIEVTDKNFDEFKPIVDMSLIEEISSASFRLRSEDQRFCLAIDSGGRQYPTCFALKGRKESKALYRKKLEDELASAKRNVEMTQHQLECFDIDEDGFYAKHYED